MANTTASNGFVLYLERTKCGDSFATLTRLQQRLSHGPGPAWGYLLDHRLLSRSILFLILHDLHSVVKSRVAAIEDRNRLSHVRYRIFRAVWDNFKILIVRRLSLLETSLAWLHRG